MNIKMKNILFVAVLACTVFTTSCGYLDKSPDADGYDDKLVFGDSTNYMKFCEYLVVVPPVQHLQNGIRPLGSYDCITDNSVSTALYSGVPSVQCQIGDYYAMRTNGDAVMSNNSTWDQIWKHIRVANTGIANIEMYSGSQSTKDKLLGLCYFYRGFCYMELTRRWGGMPYLTEPIRDASSNLDFPRLSMQQTYLNAVTDMDIAATLLPATRSKSEFHYPTSVAALAIKSRLLLYAASEQARTEVSGTIDLWERAAEATDAAIVAAETAGLTLVPMNEYYFLLKGGDDNIYTKELIFARRASIAWGSDAYTQTIRPPGQLSGKFSTAVSQNLVDCFEMKVTGLPITDSQSGYKAQEPYKGRDPRFYENVIYNGATIATKTMKIYQFDETNQTKGSADCKISSGESPEMGYTQTGYYGNRWMGKDWGAKLDQQWPEIRMAELYLNFAEAANEVGADPSTKYKDSKYTAAEALNMVRNRAEMPDINEKYLNKSDFKNRVRNERRIELAFEEHRIFDLRRWKIGTKPENRDIWRMKITKVAKSTQYPDGFKYEPELIMTRIYEDRHNLFVIKLDDTNIGPNFKQNPGW